MFKMHEIRELIKLVDQSSVQEFELESDGDKLTIRKASAHAPAVLVPAAHAAVAPVAPAAAPVPVPAALPQAEVADVPVAPPASTADKKATQPAGDAGLHPIVSPMVGTFYAAPSPDAPSYVSVGSKVNEKTIVCIVEAMKLMNEIEAEVRGEIVQILVENGQLVEYGQPLFLVKPE